MASRTQTGGGPSRRLAAATAFAALAVLAAPASAQEQARSGGVTTPWIELSQNQALSCDYAACAARYRSFRASDCTFQPYQGPRRACTVGDPTRRSAPPTTLTPADPEVAAAPTPQPAPSSIRGDEPPNFATAPEVATAPPPRAAATVSAAGDVIDGWMDLTVLGGFAAFWSLSYLRLWRGPARASAASGLHAAVERRPVRR